MLPVVQTLTDLTAHRDQAGLSRALVMALRDLFSARSVAIFGVIVDQDKRRWLPQVRVPLEPAVAGSDGVLVDVKKLSLFDLYPARGNAPVESLLQIEPDGSHINCFPLRHDSESVDVLQLHTDGLLDSKARTSLAAILRVYSNLRSLLIYGQRDSLTGLLNRKTFDDEFFKAREIVSGAPHDPIDERRTDADVHRYWVGMIDIDFFKRVNDHFGHLIGDEVLLLVAQLLRAKCRPEDLVYRFGGEEFVVLFKCPQALDARGIFERLRKHAEGYSFPQVGRVTISIGYAELLSTDSPADALGRADKAVYFAKSLGRNQVQSYADIVGQNESACEDHSGAVELF